MEKEIKAPAIYAAINSIMSEIGHVGKDKTNEQQGFKYRGVEQVMNTLKPLLSKHGVFIVPEVVDRQREERVTEKYYNGQVKRSTLIYSILTIRHHFIATDGSEVVTTMIGEGMDSGDKASNKAMAIAYKYACFQVFCIPTEEMAKDDPDGTSPDNTISSDYFALYDRIGQCASVDEINTLFRSLDEKYQKDTTIIQACATRKQQLQTA